MSKFRVLITENELRARIREMGAQISKEYEGKTIHMICILKGGIYFLTDLSLAISEEIPISVDFMSVSSYGDDTSSSGVVRIIKDLDESIEGKDVIVVEDIVDSGRTLSYILELLKDRKPNSLKLCTLLDKPSRRVVDVHVDYTGFSIEDVFVVGFGLDDRQYYRNIPYIGIVE